MNISISSKLLLFLLITSILIASTPYKNNDQDETIHKIPVPTNSRVIVGEGAKLIIGTKQSAKLWYDKLVLLSDAILLEDDEDILGLSKKINSDNLIEDAEDDEMSLPTELSISKAYPNPFNPVVNIRYGLPETADVRILIHDLIGRKIAEHSINQQGAGWHEFNWNALDQNGQKIGSGIYLMTIQASNMVKKQKITFLK